MSFVCLSVAALKHRIRIALIIRTVTVTTKAKRTMLKIVDESVMNRVVTCSIWLVNHWLNDAPPSVYKPAQPDRTVHCVGLQCMHRVVKETSHLVFVITASNIDRFSKFFHQYTQQ